ncbi:uncharacterized protein LOC123895728 [Trifolium pratense]|uniref:uncharacterized protein LOC123895728 n=1 Tax=Trifolium pratense TaxID=57577 RepID=UPI001E6976F3|nr:uncharacterized protein LOC123895728 [Trifolium pratense]
MSDSGKSSPTKNEDVPSPQVAINAIPLNTIPAISPTIRRKSVAKKDKSSRTSTNPSSPSASIKVSKRKSKKSKSESRRSFTISELHVDPLPSSGVATPVVKAAEVNVDTSGKNSLNQNLNVPNPGETLGLKDPAVSEKLGKTAPNPPTVVDTNIGASTETNEAVAAESLKKTTPETHENIEDHSESDESPQPKSADKETVPNKVVDENPEVVIVNETTVSEKLVKEFLINVADNCNDPASPEYRQVFVRGKCVKFSPTIINQYLQRDSDEVTPLKVTDNEVCKVLTGGRIKMIADLTETSRALEARKLKIDRVIEALKAEEATETVEGEPNEQEGEGTSDSEDGSEDM